MGLYCAAVYSLYETTRASVEAYLVVEVVANVAKEARETPCPRHFTLHTQQDCYQAFEALLSVQAAVGISSTGSETTWSHKHLERQLLPGNLELRQRHQQP